jgi:hypothetical protein
LRSAGGLRRQNARVGNARASPLICDISNAVAGAILPSGGSKGAIGIELGSRGFRLISTYFSRAI